VDALYKSTFTYLLTYLLTYLGSSMKWQPIYSAYVALYLHCESKNCDSTFVITTASRYNMRVSTHLVAEDTDTFSKSIWTIVCGKTN